MSSFIRRFAFAVALLTVLPAHATVVQGVIVGVIGSNSTDTQGLFGPVGAILDGKTVSIAYVYDSDEYDLQDAYTLEPSKGVEYHSFSYYNYRFLSAHTNSVSVTIGNITVKSGNYPYYDDLIFYTNYGQFTQVVGYGPQVQLYVFGLDNPSFGLPISSSSQPESGQVSLILGYLRYVNINFNMNPCATVIANGLQGPTLSGDDPNLPTTTIKHNSRQPWTGSLLMA